MNFNSIKNIIFDLGDVIINLDYDRTFSAFAHATGLDVKSFRTTMLNQSLWQDHETGLLSDADLIQYLKSTYFQALNQNQIIEIWNALLADIPKDRIELLLRLKTKYKMFLLSNTNGIHAIRFNQILHESYGIANFTELFDQVYYSHQMGLRKPNPLIYQKVLEEQKILPHETLFLDDNKDNIAAASLLGIQSWLVTKEQPITELLKNA